MAKSSKSSKESSLPYDPPFRYTRRERDLQSIFGAQIGNPPILPVEKKPAAKPVKRAKPAPVKAAKAGKVSAPKAAAPKLATKLKRSTPAAAAKATQKPKKAIGKR